MYNIIEFDLSEDFKTAIVTFSDKRVVEVPTSELTPHGEEVDQYGTFDLVYIDPFDTRDDYTELVTFSEYFDEVADDAKIIAAILTRAGIDSGLTWSVKARQAGYQKELQEYKINAANHTDLLYLLRNFVEVKNISRLDQAAASIALSA